MKYLGEDGTKKLIDLIKAKPSGKIDKILEDNGNELPITNKSITLPKYLIACRATTHRRRKCNPIPSQSFP